MPIYLHASLLLTCLLTMGYVIRKIRKSQMQIEDAVYWICFVICLFVLSVFPQLVTIASDLLDIQSSANFIFLVIIFFLLLKQFSMSIHISQLDNKIKQLTQQIALYKKID